LAAGVLLLSGWDGQGDFLDPMCGSGTFLAEAAMIACNIRQTLTVKNLHSKMA
jgi:putative N6-adenine-specific DNA methylase